MWRLLRVLRLGSANSTLHILVTHNRERTPSICTLEMLSIESSKRAVRYTPTGLTRYEPLKLHLQPEVIFKRTFRPDIGGHCFTHSGKNYLDTIARLVRARGEASSRTPSFVRVCAFPCLAGWLISSAGY